MAGKTRKAAEPTPDDAGTTEAGQVTPATLPTSADIEREAVAKDDIPKGVDGKNPVTPNNPAPKAVIKDN